MSGTAVVIGVGASAGLGAALCRRFAAEGLHVYPSGRSADKLEAVAKEIDARFRSPTAAAAKAAVQIRPTISVPSTPTTSRFLRSARCTRKATKAKQKSPAFV